MKKQTLWVAIVLMMGTAMNGCSSDNNDEPEATPTEQPADAPADDEEEEADDLIYDVDYIQLSKKQRDLVSGNNSFAFRLLQQTRAEGDNAGKNLILSPLSITYALGMLNNGAAGETQQQISQMLGFGDTGLDDINAFCRKMLDEAPRLDPETKVRIANTIYMNQPYELLPAFVETARTCYEAEPETRNFHDGRTMDVINQWASDHTKGMIKKVLDENSFNPDAVSYLLNATYFKGTWTEKFDTADTRDEAFSGYNKSLQQVPMMHMEDTLRYAEDDLCQALTMTYGRGLYQMTVLLPREGKTLEDVEQGLEARWRGYSYGNEAIVDVKLPRFEANTDVNLKEVMSKLGMPLAFDMNLAEFPYFCNIPTYIGLMKQVARIKVNEQGSEAAAVTVIAMDGTAAPGPEPALPHYVFHADRPFLYVISEQSSRAIFFVGQYVGE